MSVGCLFLKEIELNNDVNIETLGPMLAYIMMFLKQLGAKSLTENIENDSILLTQLAVILN